MPAFEHMTPTNGHQLQELQELKWLQQEKWVSSVSESVRLPKLESNFEISGVCCEDVLAQSGRKHLVKELPHQWTTQGYNERLSGKRPE